MFLRKGELSRVVANIADFDGLPSLPSVDFIPEPKLNHITVSVQEQISNLKAAISVKGWWSIDGLRGCGLKVPCTLLFDAVLGILSDRPRLTF